MSPKPREKHAEGHQAESRRTTDRSSRTECLDTEGLRRLEESFRRWVEEASAHRTARLRIFLIFLLIRHTGAKLNEVLRLNPFEDIDWENRCVLLRSGSNRQGSPGRLVDISRHGLQDIRALVEDPGVQGHVKGSLLLDAAFVRRKFYERAQACGYASHLGGPEMIRKARAMELLKGHIPLPVVQKILGTTVSKAPLPYPSFSDKDIRHVMRLFLERESAGQTSARNAFYGRVDTVLCGDIQATVDLLTLGGHRIQTVITLDSLRRLGIREGTFMVAEVKAPWLILVPGIKEPLVTCENRFHGTIRRVLAGLVTTEVTVELADGTELCAIVSSESARRMSMKEGDSAWAVFSAHAVVLHGHSGDLPWS